MGDFTVRFIATDGTLSDSQDVTIHVNPAAVAPAFAATPPVLGKEGSTVTFTVSAGDLDGTTPSFTVNGTLPTGSTFNPTTGVFTWVPKNGQSGNYALSFTATNPSTGATASETVSLTIQKTDIAPTLPVLGGHVVLIGHPFTLTVVGSSVESGAVLTYSATGLPAGAVINPTTGVLTWTPTGVQAGTYDALITVSDGTLSASQPLRLVASATAVPPAVLISLTPSFPAAVGQSVAIQVTASGVATVSSITLTINGTAVTLDSQGRATYIPTAAGHFTLVASATDADGQVGTTTTDLLVRDLTSTVGPSATLASPAGGAVLTGTTAVTGTVSDGNLKNYQLTLSPLGSSTSTVLATGTALVNNAALGSIDPGKLTNGAYLLTLTVTDLNGTVATATEIIEVDTATKAGSFSTSATDLTTTLDGASLSFTRFYQSVNNTVAGHLGNGWELAGFDPQITTNVPPATSSGAYNAFQIGTRVYFNLPDGSRAGFTFTPQQRGRGPVDDLPPPPTPPTPASVTPSAAPTPSSKATAAR